MLQSAPLPASVLPPEIVDALSPGVTLAALGGAGCAFVWFRCLGAMHYSPKYQDKVVLISEIRDAVEAAGFEFRCTTAPSHRCLIHNAVGRGQETDLGEKPYGGWGAISQDLTSTEDAVTRTGREILSLETRLPEVEMPGEVSFGFADFSPPPPAPKRKRGAR